MTTRPGAPHRRPASPARPGQIASAGRPRRRRPRPGPSSPITSFFNRDEVLVWPADSPISGDLGPKRATSDKASLAVLHEYNRQGLASIATATEARNKLLDYGRPALKFLRGHSTVRLADTFHLFLLSLYESLEQATTGPQARRPLNRRPTRRRARRAHRPSAFSTAASRFERVRSRWMTVPSRPIRTLAGIWVTP